MQKNFSRYNQKFFTESVALYRKNDLTSPLSEVVVTAILMLILFYGGTLVFAGEITGALFITFFGLASQLIPPIKQISSAYNSYQKGLASQERINQILNAASEPTDSKTSVAFTAFNQGIEFKQLSFQYPNREVKALTNINLFIPKGQTLAIVGASGSGKTTLADLIPKFHRYTEGDILIDGVSLQQITTASLRKHIAIVSQETILFNDSVYNNIVFGLEAVSEADVKEAAKIACADGFISELPEGYNTLIGDRGGKLSGGQRQRIAIARAIALDPKFIVLDEPTSALDMSVQAQIVTLLRDIQRQRQMAFLFISHDLKVVRALAHQLIVLRHGEVVEAGLTAAMLADPKSAYTKALFAAAFDHHSLG